MKYFGCPYCGNELQEEFNACCGEAGHGEMIEVDNELYDKAMTIKAIDYSDPSHGWRAVSKKDLALVGCAGLISPYSYESKTKVYLEEDRDLTIFMQFAREKGFRVVVTKDSYSDSPSPVRRKNHYNNPQFKYIELAERLARGEK